jgi:hypothetical protein
MSVSVTIRTSVPGDPWSPPVTLSLAVLPRLGETLRIAGLYYTVTAIVHDPTHPHPIVHAATTDPIFSQDRPFPPVRRTQPSPPPPPPPSLPRLRTTRGPVRPPRWERG